MKVIQFVLISMLISMLVTSACSPMRPLLSDPQGIQTVFDIYKIPGQNNPPAFSEIDWPQEDKLTIQGFSVSDPYFPGFIGDVTTGNILPLYFNNSIADGSMPLISNDGSYLAFQSKGVLYIALMDQIIANNYSISPESYLDVRNEEFLCGDVAWSPNSSQLASVCVDLSDKITISLYDLPQKSIQVVFEYFEEHMDAIEGVSWSSDGTMLAFSLRYEYYENQLSRQLSQTDIFIYHLDMDSLIRISNTPKVSERNPDWYPNSRIFTFTSTIESDAESVDSSLIFSTESGKCMKSLPNLSGFVSPTWSPDGSQLAYISDWMDIKVMDTSQLIPPDFLSLQGLCNP